MRALFIVIAGVIITTLWIQAVWSQTLSGNRRLLLQSPLFLYRFLHIYHRITFFFKRILSYFYFVLFLSVFSSGIIAVDWTTVICEKKHNQWSIKYEKNSATCRRKSSFDYKIPIENTAFRFSVQPVFIQKIQSGIYRIFTGSEYFIIFIRIIFNKSKIKNVFSVRFTCKYR